MAPFFSLGWTFSVCDLCYARFPIFTPLNPTYHSIHIYQNLDTVKLLSISLSSLFKCHVAINYVTRSSRNAHLKGCQPGLKQKCLGAERNGG